jgi:itaconate CoA-transferase
MRRRTILSLEQATALPYATMRFVQLGWRVIRIEATGLEQPGDPNRYVGPTIVDETRHALFVAPNVGKEAVALNLKTEHGQSLLKRMIASLNADIFCCNVLPARYQQLGIDYESLSAVKPDLIWAGISALGPDYPDIAGYDPIIQAMSGLMDINGFAEGPPTLIGLPLSDLKAGDELYSSVLLALLEATEAQRGKRIDVSMLQVALSLLISTLPLIDLGSDQAGLTRTGNAHRRFVPTNVYPTCDGYIYLAIGSNAQWQKFTSLPAFTSLNDVRFATATGRYDHRQDIYRRITTITSGLSEADLKNMLASEKLPHSPINTVVQAIEHPAAAAKLTTTKTPDGRTIRLPPPAVDLANAPRTYAFAPRYGEHTDSILTEIGVSHPEILRLRTGGIVT